MSGCEKIKICALLAVRSQVNLIWKEIADVLRIKQTINSLLSGLNFITTVKHKLTTFVEYLKED